MYTYIKIFPSLSLSVFLSLILTVFLTAPLLILGHGHIWEGLTAEAAGTAGPSFIISVFCSHFPVHSLDFTLVINKKYSTNRNYICPLSLIFIRARILANLFHV